MPKPVPSDPARIQAALVGPWRKRSASNTAVPYPDEITFAANGLYRGTKGDTGADFTTWDAGRAHVLSASKIKLSTATDKEIVYVFTLAGDTLTFTDPDGGTVEYRRAG